MSSYKSSNISLKTLKYTLKPFNFGKIDIESSQYTPTLNAPTLLNNRLSFKEEIASIINENHSKSKHTKDNSEYSLNKNPSVVHCYSFEVSLKPPIDISKLDMVISALMKAEGSVKHYFNNSLRNYIVKLSKKCNSNSNSNWDEKINVLNDIWEFLSISYIIRKRVLIYCCLSRRSRSIAY